MLRVIRESTIGLLLAGIVSAAAFAACAESGGLDSERPAALTGLWVGGTDADTPAAAADSIALSLDANATATVRRWNGRVESARFDSTAKYSLWKIDGSADDRGVRICLHLPATGANDCVPIRARGGDSLRLAFPARPTAPGALVNMTLRKRGP